MSNICPWHNCIYTFAKSFTNLYLISSDTLSTSPAKVNPIATNASPANIAIVGSHLVHTASTPLLVLSLSMKSSCIKLDTCTASIAAATGIANFSSPPNAPVINCIIAGRNPFPPPFTG